MERSRYFGFEKDLYHFDHFMGGFATKLGALINHSGYAVLSEESPAEGVVVVKAAVKGAAGKEDAVYAFVLVKRAVGRKAGAWMTKQCVQLPDAVPAGASYTKVAS